MTNVPMIDAMMVARKTAPHSMPDWERILGFTKRMYAMAKKVVKPAMISVRTFVPFSFSLKNLSIYISLSY